MANQTNKVKFDSSHIVNAIEKRNSELAYISRRNFLYKVYQIQRDEKALTETRVDGGFNLKQVFESKDAAMG